MIAAVLPETFIVEGTAGSVTASGSPARGLREQFGRELRGADLLSLWEGADRDAVASLLRNVVADGVVGHGRFRAYSCSNRPASFEFVLLPLIHTGDVINRVLGAITAIEPPFWLGAEPLLRQEIVELNLHVPDGHPSLPSPAGEVINIGGRRFRVLEGGSAAAINPGSRTPTCSV